MCSVLFRRLLLGLLLVASGGAGPAFATPALDFTGGTIVTNQPTRNITIGYEFLVNQPIIVDSLAYYDDTSSATGTQSHEVGLWDDTMNLIASTTVLDTDPLIGMFRYNTIADVVLTAGKQYVVGGLNLGGQWVHTVPQANMTIASEITYQENRYTWPNNDALAYPNATYPSENYGYFGGSFGFQTVPEPATLTLLGLGLAGIGFGRRWRKNPLLA